MAIRRSTGRVRREAKIGKASGIRHHPLDKTHSPFKRSSHLGPALTPKRHVQTNEWECDKYGDYIQRCVWVGSERMRKIKGHPHVKMVHIDRKYKKKYNTAYWDHLVHHFEGKGGVRKFQNKKQAEYHYRKPLSTSKTKNRGAPRPKRKS